MKFVLLLACVAIALARPEDVYEKYAGQDIDEILSNERLLKGYVSCFIGEGNCTPEGKDIKASIPDGIQSRCSKCKEEQKKQIAKFIYAIKTKLPTEFDKLIALHDSKKEHQDELEKFLNEYNV